ncbi:transmembrane protein 256 isoform X2 [Oryzias melastigma]|uniref:Transmembrane protein 256 n=1 Tax=Oryzias melastigma TaxID=30732 RepID=A0A3B3BC76_ORYME|nr:transmembrane protein 256 isoform X2 [Oryzias melastigma]
MVRTCPRWYEGSRLCPERPPLDSEHTELTLYETANKYHFYHSLALLGAAHCGKPIVAGTLLIAGMGMFCGPLYHQALTKDPSLSKLAPMGGMAMIAGWLAMIL